jgi:hypothetical protein
LPFEKNIKEISDRLHKSGAGNGRETQYSFSGETEVYRMGVPDLYIPGFRYEKATVRESMLSMIPTRSSAYGANRK